jgi:hypothetical protein
MCHIDCAQLIGGGEAVQLAGGHGLHERGLATPVVPTQAVPPVALQVQPRVVQQDLTAVAQTAQGEAQLTQQAVVTLRQRSIQEDVLYWEHTIALHPFGQNK